MNLWNVKAEQVKQKADLVLVGDPIVKSTFDDITTSREKIQKSVKIRAGIGMVI